MAKKLFLTGGRGMVGRNIQAHARAADWTVVAPTSEELDLTDTNAVAAFYAAEKPDAVIHAAGKVGGIHTNMADPVGFLDVNTMLGRNVILEAYRSGVRVLINLGSSCMYPAEAPNPLREDMILTAPFEQTNEGYAIAKVFATRLCQYIRAQDEDAHFKTLIPCNLFGLHDKFDPEKSHLVPAIIHKMHLAKVADAPEVDIWGDGTARREFLFAGDLADAALRAVADPKDLPDVMNIAPGFDLSINDYYAAVAEFMGWSGKFVHDLTKPVGVKQKRTDISRQEAWGWAPATSLEDGLKQTYDFYLREVAA